MRENVADVKLNSDGILRLQKALYNGIEQYGIKHLGSNTKILGLEENGVSEAQALLKFESRVYRVTITKPKLSDLSERELIEALEVV